MARSNSSQRRAITKITKKYGQKLIYPSQEQPRYEVVMKKKLFLSMFK